MNKIKSYTTLAVWIVSYQLIGFLMGQMTKTNIASWYVNLNKAPLTPPNITFGIVWSILYVILAYIGYALFTRQHQHSLITKIIYSLQMLLNWSWTPIFFSLHLTGLGLLILSAMVLMNAYLCYLFYQDNKILAALNLLYLLWISFALYLNAYIFLYN